MIEKIIGATIIPILQELIWADQIGWLVTPYTRRVEVSEGNFTDNIIPVAPNVTVDDCGETSLGMKILTTDQGYRSLMLIKADGGMSSAIADNIAQRKGLNIDQDITIAVWLNDHQGTIHHAKGELIREFSRRVFKDITVGYSGELPSTMYDFHINKLKVTFTGEASGNPFSEYSFGSDYGQFHDTYAAFGLTFHLSGLIFPCALPPYPPLDHGCQFAVTAVAADNTVCTGSDIELSIISDVIEGDTYQWQQLISDEWTNITGATDETYTVEADGEVGDVQYYRVKVTRGGSVSESNTVTITLHMLDVQINWNTFENPDASITQAESITLLSAIVYPGPSSTFTRTWEMLVDDEWVLVESEPEGWLIIQGSEHEPGEYSYRATAIWDNTGCTGTSAPVTITVTP